MEKYDEIFISYSSRDYDVASKLKKTLERKKFNVFLADVDTIKNGEDFRTKIIESMQQIKFVLVVLSDNSTKSNWVNLELTYALNNEKKIYTINIDNTKINELLEFKLGCTQIASVIDNLEAIIESLSISINNDRNKIIKLEQERLKKNANTIKYLNLNVLFEIIEFITLIKNGYDIFSGDRETIEKVILFAFSSILIIITSTIFVAVYKSIIKKQSNLGNASAQYIMYMNSYKVDDETLELLRKSAHSKYPKALRRLSKMYEKGHFVEKDEELAKEYYEQYLASKTYNFSFKQILYYIIVIFVLILFISLIGVVLIS